MNADLLSTIAAIQQQTASAGIIEIISRRRPDGRDINAFDTAGLAETAKRPPAPPDLPLAL